MKSIFGQLRKERVHLQRSNAALVEAAKDALNVVECNCGRVCQGTCTHSLLTRAVALAEGRD